MILSRRIEGNPPLCGDGDELIGDQLLEALPQAWLDSGHRPDEGDRSVEIGLAERTC